MAEKHCVECKHHKTYREYSNTPGSDHWYWAHQCYHPSIFDPIKGGVAVSADCQWMRGGWCGRDASLFEPAKPAAEVV